MKNVSTFIGAHKLILSVVAILATLFLMAIVYRRSTFKFVDVHDSRWADAGNYDWFEGATLSDEYKQPLTNRMIVQVNSPTLYKAGDKVEISFADPRAGRKQVVEILEMAKRNLLVVDLAPTDAGNGPWSGTVKLVKE